MWPFNKKKDDLTKLIVAENNIALIISSIIVIYTIALPIFLPIFIYKNIDLGKYLADHNICVISIIVIIALLFCRKVYKSSMKDKKEVLERLEQKRQQQYDDLYKEIKALRIEIKNLNSCKNVANCINKASITKDPNPTNDSSQ